MQVLVCAASDRSSLGFDFRQPQKACLIAEVSLCLIEWENKMFLAVSREQTGFDDSNDSLSHVTFSETLCPHLSVLLSPHILSAFYPHFTVVMTSPQRFLGNSLLQWTNLAPSSVPWHVELMFRTRQASATLLHIASGLQHNLTLQVRATKSCFVVFLLHLDTQKHTR